MATLKNKINKFWNKYDAHVLAFLFTTFFMTAFWLIILEIIDKAFG